jgi:anti-anti-sigma factor
VSVENGTASVVLTGVLDESVVAGLERNLQEALAANPRRVLLRAEQLTSLTSAGARALLFLRQKLPFEDVEVYLVGANEGVQEACRAVDTEEQSFVIVDDASQLEPLQA